MPGGYEWIIILVVAVLIFGRRLPEIARGMGKSLTEFKKGVREAHDDVTSSVDDDVSPIEEAERQDAERDEDAQNTEEAESKNE